MRKSMLLVFVLACSMVVFSGVSHAENFASVYVGGAIPHEADATDNTGSGGSGTWEFDSSAVAGVKLGHWFNEQNAPYFGVEADLNLHFPDLSKQSGTLSGGTQNMEAEVIIWGGTVNGLLRYPEGDVRPYVGAGGGIFHANFDDGLGSVSGPFTGDEDTRFGWQLLGGVDWTVTDDISVFAEYKYTIVDFEFDDPSKLGVDVNYRASHVYGGVSYRF